MEIDENKRELILEVVDRFLTTHRPTSPSVVRARVWDKALVLAELDRQRILFDTKRKSWGIDETEYLPRLLAFELIADERRLSYALDIADSWLNYLRRSALRSDSLDLELPDRAEEPPERAKWSSLHFVQDFSKLVEVCAPPRVKLAPAIRDFENAPKAWAEELQIRGLEPTQKVKRGSHHGRGVSGRTLQPSHDQRTASTTPPPAQRDTFAFVKDPAIRTILERDHTELGSLPRKALKARFVLAGGIIEGTLLDALIRDSTRARLTTAGLRENRDLEQWGLSALLDASVELGLISPSAQSFGHAVREYRNLVHPGLERRKGLSLAIEEVEIAEKVLQIVLRDLAP
jgi:hypothetical protein